MSGPPGSPAAQTPGPRHSFVVPPSSAHRIQEAQATIFHARWELTQEAL